MTKNYVLKYVMI